jgi:hypothetical protein
MVSPRNGQQRDVSDWSSLAELRFIAASDLDRKESIQTEFDFAEAKFLERHATCPHRAVIRAEKEAELLAAWEQVDGTILRAPWRAGKTELVFAAIDHANLFDRFLFINSQDAPYPALRWRSSEEFRKIYGAREAVDHVAALQERLGENVSRSEIAARLDTHIGRGGNPFSFVARERRERQLPPVLVALDEIADYAYDPAHLAYIASLARIEHVRLCLIVQRAPTIEPRYDNAFPDFRSIYLSPLTLGESAQLVQAKAKGCGISLSVHAIVEIHRAAGGRPLEVSALVDVCRQAKEDGKHGGHYGRADIDKLVRGKVVPLTTTPLEPLIVNHIRVYERGITVLEQALIDRLLRCPWGESITAETGPIVEGLARYGLVALSNDRVYLNGALFRDVVLKRMTDYRTHNYWQPGEYGNDYV